jgi:hypothetical protein
VDYFSPLLYFCFVFFYLLSYIKLTFYLFLLYSGLLISIFFQFVPVLYSSIVFWCLPALHLVLLPWSSVGLRLSPILYFTFRFICLLIMYYTFFPFYFSHFAHVNILVCLFITPLRISSLTECLSSKLHYHGPNPPPHFPTTLLAGTTLLRTFHRPHFSLYKHRIGTAGFLFGFLKLEAGTDRLSRNVGKKLPLLAA